MIVKVLDGLKTKNKGYYMPSKKQDNVKVAKANFKVLLDEIGNEFKEYKKGEPIAPEHVKIAGSFAVDALDAIESGLGQEVLEKQLEDKDATIQEQSEKIAQLETANDNLIKKVSALEEEVKDLEEKLKAKEVAEEEPKQQTKPKTTRGRKKATPKTKG